MNTAYRHFAILALSLISMSASAQGWFAGGAVGQAKQSDFSVGGPVATRDDTDASFRVFGGFLVSPRQGVVVSYIDLGDTFYDGAAFGGFTDSQSATGIDVSYIAGWAPGTQERISIFGTVGVFDWDQDITYTDATTTILYKDEGTSFSLGVGADINLSENGTNPWGIHIEWQLFKDVGDNNNSGHEYDRDVFSVGVSYRFGGN